MANNKSRNRPSPGKRLLGAVWYLLVLGFVFAGGCLAGWLQKSPMMMSFVKQTFAPKPPEVVFGGKTSLTMLILGADEGRNVVGVTYDKDNKPVYQTVGDKKNSRADMILVAKLDFEHNRITGLSVPRDLECRLEGYRTQKINAYYRYQRDSKKAGLMPDAVSHVFNGIHIDRTVVLDFDAFQEMVNVAGGITVNVEKRMKYDDDFGNVHVDLQPGRQTLNGYNSLMFVRFRKGEGGDSDFGRQDRQKQFLVAFKQAMMRDITRLPNVLNEAVNVMGGEMTEDELASIAMFSRGVKPEDIHMGSVPTTTVRRNGQSFERFKRGEPEQTMQQFGLLGSREVASR